MSDLEKAKDLLTDGVSCVAVRGEDIKISHQTGIAPFMNYIAQGVDLKGYSVADKIVGKAAALLFVKCGIVSVYAVVLSEAGRDVLQQNGIAVSYGELCDNIINRKGDDICPMEKTVLEVDDPEVAYPLLRQTIERLKSKQ
ncbi:MAG: DUF1893 domain-containing protein [Clostridia bacterium]|nr:DUF1893 domain-containing protein [Clostridia bacterium]